MNIQRIAAFSFENRGGNPAGVWIGDELPAEHLMQSTAAEVGFSETAFACPQGDKWRVRYFSPQAEVPFCGHATIALGAALAGQFGDGVYPLILNHAEITVESRHEASQTQVALQSPPTRSESAPQTLVTAVLELFGYRPDQLDPRIPPAIAEGGARHLVLALNSRQALKAMRYDFAAGQVLMRRESLTTIMLVWAQDDQHFHSRNAFAYGGVYEDPATGAASAAFAGYLRDIGWAHKGRIDLIQGEDMGAPSAISARISAVKGSSIRISGTARIMTGQV